MVTIKDGKKYYSYEELIDITDKQIEIDAKEFARKIIEKQKEIVSQENIYV